MPTIFSHAVSAVAISAVFSAFPLLTGNSSERLPGRFWLLAPLCAILPDADVIGLAFGIRSGDLFGHRGFSHSIIFAALLAGLMVAVFFRKRIAGFGKWLLRACFFLATVSHACLDALTNGGPGVAFFAPFEKARYFFPWRPVEVSPIGASFFSGRGLVVISNEFIWIWLPSLFVVGICGLVHYLAVKDQNSDRRL